MTEKKEFEIPILIKPSPNAIDITPHQDGGVLKEIVKPGQGEGYPPYGSTVVVHYVGKLTDGSIFDSSKKEKPFEFTLGKEIVIKGWDIAISSMKKGEQSIFTCNPEYAYKTASHRNIPSGATLIFEITMVNWSPEDLTKTKDGGINKVHTLVPGRGYSSPNDGALCDVRLIGKYGDRVFEDRQLKFKLGEGCEEGMIEGVETALKSFRRGEKSVINIKPRYAFRDEGNEELGIPPDAPVQYIVELKNFEQSARTWDMTTEERISQAKTLKEKANNYYKAEKYNMAVKFYTQVAEYIGNFSGFDENELVNEVRPLLLASKLNLALVHLKLHECYEARNDCDEALEIDPNNVKAHYRRGLAYMEMGEPEKGKIDFDIILELEPNNTLAFRQALNCLKLMREQRERERKIYYKMFEKFARQDREEGSTRYGWWDDEKKEPVIDELDQVDVESIEEAKAEKKKQLEKLKRIAKVKKEEKEAQSADEGVKKENLDETKDVHTYSE